MCQVQNGARRGGGGGGSADGNGKWTAQSHSFRNSLISLGLGHDRAHAQNVWCEGARLQGISATPRVLELIDCAYLSQELCVRQRSQNPLQCPTRKEVSKALFVDCSQAISRKPWSATTMRTLTTSSNLYSFESDRLVLSQEHLRLLGFPEGIADGLCNTEILDLAGNAMSLASCAAAEAFVLVAAFLHGALPDLLQPGPESI